MSLWTLWIIISSLLLGSLVDLRAVTHTRLKTWEFPKANSNRAFLDTTCGDFDGDGIAEIALLKQAHSQIIILSSPADTTLVNEGALDTAYSNPVGIAAGDFDGDGDDELAVLRPGSGSNILVYNYTNSWALMAQLAIGSSITWVDIATGDFDGNGTSEIVVARKQAPQFLFYKRNGSSLTPLSSILRGTTAAENDWRAIGAGNFDPSTASDEFIAVRQGAGTHADCVFYKNLNWSFSLAGTANCNGGTVHYSWLDVAAGEFDGNKANGEEFVLYKNAHTFFIYSRFIPGTPSTATINTFQGHDGQSEIAFPWTGVAAGDLILNNGLHEVVSIRQKPVTEANPTTLDMYGDEISKRNEKLNNLQAPGFKSFGTYQQGLTVLRNAEDSNALDTLALKKFADDNSIQTFNFILSDHFGVPAGEMTVPTAVRGREFKALVYFLKRLKDAQSTKKVIVTLCTPMHSPTRKPYPAESAYLAGDEMSYFTGGTPTDPYEYVSWFKLLGIVATQYPNLVGINIDDFSHYTNIFTSELLGQMVKALRRQNEKIAFIPTIYYSDVHSSRAYMRNYTDGFIYYFRSESQQNVGLHALDITRQGTAWNMHGLNTLVYFDDEINNVDTWLNNPAKILFAGVYASTHSQSTTAPIHQCVVGTVAAPGQVRIAAVNSKCDGITVYTTQSPGSDIGKLLYPLFRGW